MVVVGKNQHTKANPGFEIAEPFTHLLRQSAGAMTSRRKLRSFHRLITSDDIHQNALKIPKKFTRDHRNQILLNDVLLIVSDDKVWPVGWMVSGDGKLWLQKGWPEFHRHYCLKFGHLLVFNHLGKSIFHVRIFNPRYREVYNNCIPPKKYLKSEKEIERSEVQQDEVMFLEETEDLHAPTTCEGIEVKGDLASKKGETQRSRNRALISAKSCDLDSPSYSVTVQESYLKASMLYAPVQFCRRYLTSDRSVMCILQMSNGGRWGPVECRVHKNFAKLCGENLKKFSDENHLGVDDVCVFELINDIEKVMKVTISRAC